MDMGILLDVVALVDVAAGRRGVVGLLPVDGLDDEEPVTTFGDPVLVPPRELVVVDDLTDAVADPG